MQNQQHLNCVLGTFENSYLGGWRSTWPREGVWQVSYLKTVSRIFWRCKVILVWTKMWEDKCWKTFVCLGCWGNVLTIFQGFVFSSWLMKLDIELVYMTVVQQEKSVSRKKSHNWKNKVAKVRIRFPSSQTRRVVFEPLCL